MKPGGPENRQRLDCAGPGGDPARGIAGVVRRNDQQMIDAGALHDPRKGVVPALVFVVGKARNVLLENRMQFGGKIERLHDEPGSCAKGACARNLRLCSLEL